MQTSDVVECPHCEYQDEAAGFATWPLPRKRREAYALIYRCPRCSKPFAPKTIDTVPRHGIIQAGN